MPGRADAIADDFADLRYALGRKWTRDEESGRWSMNRERAVGPDLQKRRIIHVRAMFNYARESRLLADVPLYGDEFKIVPIAQLRKARRSRAREHGPTLFPQEQVPLIHAACDVAFLLSVLCGFNEADCGPLPMRALDLKNGFIDFDRVKTGVYRRVALPRALKAALKAVLDARPTTGRHERPRLVSFKDDQEEATWIADEVKRGRDEGVELSRQAVLFRSSYRSIVLQIALRAKTSPSTSSAA